MYKLFVDSMVSTPFLNIHIYNVCYSILSSHVKSRQNSPRVFCLLNIHFPLLSLIQPIKFQSPSLGKKNPIFPLSFIYPYSLYKKSLMDFLNTFGQKSVIYEASESMLIWKISLFSLPLQWLTKYSTLAHKSLYLSTIEDYSNDF